MFSRKEHFETILKKIGPISITPVELKKPWDLTFDLSDHNNL